MKMKLPDGWKNVELGDVTVCLDGQRVPLNSEERSKMQGDIPYYGATGKVDSINKHIFDEELLLLAEDGGAWGSKQKCAYIVNGKSWVNNHAHVLKMTKAVNISYLMHFLNHHDLNRFISGTTRGKLNQGAMKKIPIILPSISVQEKIVSILEKAVKTKEMRKKADELTKDYLQAIFLEMFGEPLTNSKKWEIKKMKDISKKIVSGTTPKGGKEVYVEKGIVFFRSQNVWKNRLSFDDVAYIDDDTHAKMITSSLKNKDILMTKTGRINTENSSLGRAAMFLGEDNSANINGHVYLIRLQENIIPEFVLFIITTNEYREYIRSVCVGAIDKRQINKEHLENFPIIFPPVELQIKFVSILKEVEEMKEQQKQSRIQIHNLFNHLMQKAFKGEIAC